MLRRMSRRWTGREGYIVPFETAHLLPESLLEVETRRPKNEIQDHNRLMYRVVLAFFLKGYELEGLGGVVGFDVPTWANSIGRLESPLPLLGSARAIRELDKSTFEEVVDLAFRIPEFSGDEANQKEIALDRALKAFGARSRIAGFLDMVIALEALLLGGVQTELSYRFALYGGLFLRTERVPTETFRQLKNIYKVRSQMVHGTPVKSAERDAAVNDAHDLAQVILHRAVMEGWPNPADMDTAALTASGPNDRGSSR